MTDCNGCRELLGGYVLGALDPDDVARVEQHIESCPRCGREYGELSGMPALLDLAGSADAELESPPPALEEAVLDRFARERRGQTPAPRISRRRFRVGAALAAAAAIAVALVVLTGLFSSSSDEAFGHVHMTGGAASGDADLQAVREGTYVHLRVRGLDHQGPGMYELWCIPDKGRWISGGTFRVDAAGRAEVELTSAARPWDYERMVVTSRQPDGNRVALAGRVEY